MKSNDAQAKFWTELGRLLGGGVPLLEALESLSRGPAGPLRQAVRRAAASVRGQRSFSDGLRASPKVFGPAVVDAVRRAEAAGDLDRAAARLGENRPIKGLPPPRAMRRFGELVARAAREGASAIHVASVFDEKSQVSVPQLRLRVGGALGRPERLSDADYREVLSRTKQLSGLDLAEQKLPQEGRMMLELGGKRLDVQASFAPCVLGERLALRIFAHAEPRGLGDLKLPDEDAVRRWCRGPRGLVVLSGPALPENVLYALLAEARDGRQVATVEDPVESVLAGADQIQVEPRLGLTFPRALRAALRQEPDVLGLGDVSDGETARLAVEAALAGKLVFARVAAPDTSAALDRLAALGVDARLLSQALAGALAWKSVGRLCRRCRRQYEPTAAELVPFGDDADILRGLAYRAVGCRRCHGGYDGAITLWEARGPGETPLQPILRDGLSRVAQGLTSLEQLQPLGSG
ncbi:MAG: Flp pilus assembly complex ATPase component TadA [Planctomycetes bacterium]|nr:Flp pilus assembly complex ATPase component TadA [Planctomycetota bacterium]